MDCKLNFIFLKDKHSGIHDLEFVYKVFCIFLNFRFEATEHLILPLWRLKGRVIASLICSFGGEKKQNIKNYD